MTGTDAIWRDFGDRLRGYIARRVDSPDDADDILQNVFVKIHSRLHQLGDESKVAPWVYRIAQNAVHDFYRSKSTTKAVSSDELDTATEPDKTEGLEIEDWMQGAIRELPEKYREAIQLTELEGLTRQQLARRTGISLSGAKSRVQRGRAMIREMLLACCHLELDRRGNIVDMKRRDDCRYCQPGCGEEC